MRLIARHLSRYLEPGAPTGLTGLLVHKSPRSALINLYDRTLAKLEPLPNTSLYRRSVEAVTRHRRALVDASCPEGHEEWLRNANRAFSGPGRHCTFIRLSGRTYVAPPIQSTDTPYDILNSDLLWDSSTAGAFLAKRTTWNRSGIAQWSMEGLNDEDREQMLSTPGAVLLAQTRPKAETASTTAVTWAWRFDTGLEKEHLEQLIHLVQTDYSDRHGQTPEMQLLFCIPEQPKTPPKPLLVELEAEPQLTVDQISELESKIGAGLIEEVIEVAKGELKLIDLMVQGKVWDPLEEAPVKGQWEYFERDV